MSTNDPRDKKIIIDEDWKSRVQAEKEQIEQKRREQQSEHPTAEPAEMGPLPRPSLSTLVTTLGMQALAALGFAPDPLDGKAEVHLDQARHLIDMLQMLEEKTKGNRTEEETAVLDDLLHELRMGYVARVQQQPG
ncbi:MAG: DUF1844 domain-containing protein [Pirellulales bacterium]|nr:DUF1844 domain-containing protein [Pirellulales bacterium]